MSKDVRYSRSGEEGVLPAGCPFTVTASFDGSTCARVGWYVHPPGVPVWAGTFCQYWNEVLDAVRTEATDDANPAQPDPQSEGPLPC